MTDTIYVLNGPNLNLLGTREPEIYGHDTLDDIAGQLEDRARELDLDIDMLQSNHEGHLVDRLHEAQARGAKAVINAPLRAEVDPDDIGLQVFEFLGKCPFQVLPRPFCLTYCAK